MTDHGSLRLPDGLIGFPDARDFEIRQLGGSLFDLACPAMPGGGVVAVPIGSVAPDAAAALVGRGLARADDAILVVLTLGGGAVTANLAAPLVIDPATREGRQVLVEDQAFPLRHPVAGV